MERRRRKYYQTAGEDVVGDKGEDLSRVIEGGGGEEEGRRKER